MIDSKDSINGHEDEKLSPNDIFEKEQFQLTNENLPKKGDTNSDIQLKYVNDESKNNYELKRAISAKVRAFSFFSDFKDYLLTIVLLGSSLFDFSILNLPYTLAGIIFLFLILRDGNCVVKTKSVIVLILLILNILNLVFKIFIHTADHFNWMNICEFVQTYKVLLLDLGLRYLEKDETSYIIHTYAGEIIVFIALIFSLVIRHLERREVTTNTLKKYRMFKTENYKNMFMCLISVLTLGTTCINQSFLSIFMSILVHVGLVLWSLNKKTNYHNCIYYILCVILIISILLTHIFNIYELKIEYMYETSENKIVRWIGIKKMKNRFEYFFYILLLVLAASVSMVSIRLNSYQNKTKTVSNEDSYDKNASSLENQRSIWSRFKETAIEYIYSPYFSLHFCRVGIIIWICSYNNYPTIGLLLWLIYSFLNLQAWKIRLVTFIALPFLFIQFYVFMLSNMKGFMEQFIEITDENKSFYKQFCIQNFEEERFFNFAFVNLTILFFAIFIKTNVPPKNENRKWSNIFKDGVGESLLDKTGVRKISNSDDKQGSLNKSNNIGLKDLLAKLFIQNIDKITLIFMYIIAIQKVGIAHFILTIIFLIQLILPGAIKKLCIPIILTILLIFSFEYIWDLMKIHVTLTESLINFINLFIEFNGSDLSVDSVEYVLPFVVYCYYIQYQNYNSTVYLNFQNRMITFKSYLENLLHNYDKFKNFILFSFACIQEIFIWVILGLLFACIAIFNYYVTFGIKLFLFFIVMYKFLTLSKNTEDQKRILKYLWILIIYCGINTMLIYFYQFTELKYIQPWYKKLEDKYPQWVKENLVVIGFEKYSGNIPLKFLPHYGSNFLSVLLLWEIIRIYKTKSELRILGESKINNINEKSVMNHKERTYSSTSSVYISEFSREISQNNLDSTNIQKIKYFKFYTFQSLIFFCKTYWLLIFLSISAFIVNYQMSLGMIFYIIIFSFSFNFMFKDIISSMNTFMKKNNKFYISRLIRLTLVESPRNIRVQRKNRKTTFKYLLVCGLLYILLTYFYILFDIMQNGGEEGSHNYPIVSETAEEYVKSIAYIFGVFYNNTKNGNFIGGIWGHFLMICLITFDKYIQIAQNLMTTHVEEEKRKMKLNAKIMSEEKAKTEKRKISIFKKDQLKEDETNIYKDNKDESFKSARSLPNRTVEDNESEIVRSKKSQVEQPNQIIPILNEKNTILQVSANADRFASTFQDNLISLKLKDEPLIAKFLQVFENYRLTALTNKSKYLNLNTKNKSMPFIIATKKLLEEFILFMILFSAILKLNVISFVYMGIVIILQFIHRNVRTIYLITVFMCISLITQTLIFLSNLNENTDPNPNKEILQIINQKLFIPWYPKVLNDSWAFYLNLGVNSYQLNILWIEFIIVITCFIYLDNFSYSIYDQESQNVKKINYHNLIKKNSLRRALTDISEEDYENLRNNLNYNFDMNLAPYKQLKEIINLNKEFDKNSEASKNVFYQNLKIKYRKKKGKCLVIADAIKKITFLAMHNFILVITIILSMMNSGLISVVYIVLSLSYLFTSSSLLLGKKYSFPHAIKNFLRIFFICDLFIQLIYQNPWNVYLKKYDYILKSIGINKTIDYDYGPDQTHFDTLSAIMDCMKAVTYFLISIQILIYSSPEFKEFYLNYIFKKKEIFFKNSLLNSFLFNNINIKMMEKTAANRQEINKILKELEDQLQNWDSKLSSGRKISDNIKSKDNIMEPHDFEDKVVNISNSDEIATVKNHLKEKILGGFIINLVLQVYRNTTSYSFIEKKYKKELEIEIIRGETCIKSGLERRIEEFLEELSVGDVLKDEYKHLEGEKQSNQSSHILHEDKLTEKKQNEDGPSPIIISPLEKIENKKYSEIFQNVLYKKYIPKSYIFYFTLNTILKYFLHNFQYICFLFMIINHLMYASLISLFWPLVVFGYALIEYPRPKKKFWEISIQYAAIVLILKFMIQFKLFRDLNYLLDIIKTLDHYKIGLKVFDSNYSSGFLFYIIFDVTLILCLLLQEYFLIDRGIWEETEPEIEGMEEAYDRINKARAVKEENIHNHVEILLSKNLSTYSKNKNYQDVINSNLIIKNDFYTRVFPTVRNYKPGGDYYAIYTGITMLLIIYIIVFYTDMDRDNMFQIEGKTNVRQFSGTMVLIAFFFTITAIIDRVIYLQNRNNLKFEYVYFDKRTGDKLNQAQLNEIGITSHEEAEKNENISSIYYQIENTNYPAICKYVLQIVILILSHLFIFFFLPFIGNLNLQNSIYCENSELCNDFSSNYYIIFFYLMHSVYLFYSAKQIKYGLLEMRRKSLFVRGDNIIYSSAFKVYKAIPFLFELKLTIDWTFTPTCLDLFKWLKFESVYDLLFTTHCLKKSEKLMPIGKNIGVFNKLMMGGSSFVILLAIILGPLLIFSTLNPANVENNVTGASIELSICFQQNQKVFNNFTLFKNQYVESIIEMSKEKNIWNSYGYNKSPKTKNFPMNQVQKVNMSDTSDTIWDIAGPHIETIIDRLEHYELNNYNITLGFIYNFQRPFPPNAKDSIKRFEYPLYITGNINKNDTIKQLLDNIKYCKNSEMILSEFYYPSVRLSSSPHPKLINDNDTKKIDVLLNLICSESGGEIDYTKSYFTFKKSDIRDPDPGITFHTFSDKVSETSANYDVMTFYISFILVIGRLLRGALSGEAEKIILSEMPEPGNLINLCEGIKISRYRLEFEREEHLYFVLIDFMRSPEILKMLTKSSIKSLQERKNYSKKTY